MDRHRMSSESVCCAGWVAASYDGSSILRLTKYRAAGFSSDVARQSWGADHA